MILRGRYNLIKIYRKREFILKLIIININDFIFYTKKKLFSFINFPFKAVKAIKNIIFGLLRKDLQFISKGNYLGTQSNQRKAICIGFTEWKRAYFQEYIPNKDAYYLHNYIPTSITIAVLKKLEKNYDVYIWSYLERKELSDFFKTNDIPINRVEDGFVRSIGLGANQTKPLSLVVDSEGLYFNAQKQSGLESIIFNNSQSYTDDELKLARDYIDEINTKKITKYNFKDTVSIDNLDIYLDAQKKTVLVIGQVEDDMSIKLGTNEKITNLDLVELAYQENQNCNIIFKPHPDILHKKRNNNTNIKDYAKFALVVIDNFALFDLINISDHVYTITSLSGFEALLQGKKVTCLGSPFYAHWGLTDDRSNVIERRKNYSLTIEQLFYASYIEYPKYFLGTLSQTIDAIEEFEYVEEYLYKEKLQIVNSDFEIINLKDSDYKNKKIAILTMSKEIIELYSPLKSEFRNSDFFTFTHAEASMIIDTKLVNAKDFKWLSRFYATPLSEVEKNTISLASNISNIYSELLSELFDDIFHLEVKEKLLSVLALSLEDAIYDQCAIIKSLEFLEKDYDKIIIHIDRYHKILLLSSLLLSKLDNNKILFVNNCVNNMQSFYNKISQSNDENVAINLDLLNKKLFKSNWYKSLILSSQNVEQSRKEKVMLCGNLSNRNYGYFPSSIEIMKILSTFPVEQFFLASLKLNEQSAAQYEWLLRESKCNAKLINNTYTQKKNTFNVRTRPLVNALKRKLFIIIEKRFSSETAYFIQDKLFASLEIFPEQLVFFSKMVNETKDYLLLITTMDRTIYSRLTTIAAQMNGVYTVGVQPVLLSTSPRYKKPIVDFMYVVDDMQKENYYKLGYHKDKIICVGSANLRKNINLIEQEDIIDNFTNGRIGILFIMQHSMSTLMLNILDKLIRICKNENIILYIKPHPHQEKSTVSKVYFLQKKYSNAILLDSKDNTYVYVKNCDVIVGLYSNVIFEAILADKDVLILKNETLHESIDFSKLNISIVSEVSDNIYEELLGFIRNTQKVVNMRERRKKFIVEHKYYFSNKILKENLSTIIKKLIDKGQVR